MAARNPSRAKRFAQKHNIPSVFENYNDLIESDEVDAIYNPLPNSHHAYWSIRAMQAGKHVLCEKPIAANTQDAIKMQRVATQHERVLMEAFHWRYHPLALRIIELLTNQTIGRVTHIASSFCVPLPFSSDIRYNIELAGGALMDMGCYPISILRHLMNEEPTVIEAKARKASAQIDRYMEAKLQFPSGATGHLRCAMWGWPILSVHAHIYGTQGTLAILNPVVPHVLYHHLKIRSPTINRTERFSNGSTYEHQLRHFVAAIHQQSSIPTDGHDAICNMKVIDAIYQKSGMQPRTGYWPTSSENTLFPS